MADTSTLAAQLNNPHMFAAQPSGVTQLEALRKLVEILQQSQQSQIAPPSPQLAPAAEEAYVYGTPRMPPGNTIHTSDRKVRVVSRLDNPVLAVLDDVLSPQECDEMIRISKIRLKQSSVIDPQTGAYVADPGRTSSDAVYRLNETKFIARIDKRVSQLMGLPVEYGEGFNVVHYETGGEFKPHYDYYVKEQPGGLEELKRFPQRVATMILYLNNVEEGGTTVFPMLKTHVVPKKGSAVYFEYGNSLGQVNPLSLHGGMPVLKGQKWIATKWMHCSRFG